MKVAIVHDYLNQMGGAEKVLEAFVELFPHAPIYTQILDQNKISKKLTQQKIVTTFIHRLPLAQSQYKKYLPLFPLAIESIDLSNYDLVLSTSSAFAKGVLTKPNTTHICYCHTPMRYVWDLYHRYLAEDGPSWLYKKILPFILHYIRNWDKLSADRVDYYIANSVNVAHRIKKYYRRDSHVIYPPVETERFYIKKSEGFYLIVSRLLPYKRIDIVIEAFRNRTEELIIIGDGYDRKRLELMASSNVTFLGFQENEVIADYYSRCRAFLFPGEEDFGITPLEAQASGKPVIAYAAGGALETVVANKTGVFFAEQHKDAVLQALDTFNQLTFDENAIRLRALTFDTKLFKEKIVKYIEEIMQS